MIMFVFGTRDMTLIPCTYHKTNTEDTARALVIYGTSVAIATQSGRSEGIYTLIQR